ncbi:hypothetical protein JK167_13780 [Levilactobacillus brevis]|uniref:Uncharacterized protein n=1 Tax=Levilactobacillus brevis TaxID=1580 RepID=A0AA41ES41_LEVBR|nr:hypothetical protein [Levilactobacillus brevis]MBS0948687.1 hypothetical protein [Levilactobacillus brevis]MBS1011866.1 hypothetical protein [Levilactobacillus brevis]
MKQKLVFGIQFVINLWFMLNVIGYFLNLSWTEEPWHIFLDTFGILIAIVMAYMITVRFENR